jgi:uncharacterized repeat protein (TIGR01451 family)
VDGNVRTRIGFGRLAARAVLVASVLAAGSWTLAGPAAATGSPDVTITKTSDTSGPVSAGDGFSYTVAISNAGRATAHDIRVQDDLPVGVAVTTVLPDLPGGHCTVASSVGTGHREAWSVTCLRSSLDAGASVAVTFAVELTDDVHCGALTNTASVEAADEPEGAQDDDAASVSDTVTCPPSIEITKTAPAFAHVGSTVRLTMRVTNSGPIPLRGVVVADAGCDKAPTPRGHGNGDDTLSHGETWIYGCTHVVRTDATDWLATTATVRAASSAGPAHASARAATRVLRPKLSISVTPDPMSGTPGDTVTYHYVARNTGNTTLTDVAVVDDHLGTVGTIVKLVPGHSATLSADRVLAARDPWVTNTATATGDDPSGHPVTASDSAAVTIVAATATGGATSGGGGRDGTAFTGSDATLPGVVAVALAITGFAALAFAQRRRG